MPLIEPFKRSRPCSRLRARPNWSNWASRFTTSPPASPATRPTAKGSPASSRPLVKSDWVLEPQPGRIIRAVLDGLSGPITVEGQSFNGAMVPWRDALTDEEIAAVLTYVRQNPTGATTLPPVTPERVKEVRAKTKGHTQSCTPEELLKISPAD